MYDSIIIGGGIAGLTSALYLARANLKVLLLEAGVCGGQIINATNVENYPGILSISGYDLISNIKNQLSQYNNVEIKYERVISLTKNSVSTEKGKYDTKTIIIASGLVRRQLNIEEEEALVGSGVSYCATCDGAFFKNRDVAVVGGGNTALDETLYLSKIANKIYLIIRGEEFRGDLSLVNKIEHLDNVEILKKTSVTRLIGNPLSSIEINNSNVLNVSGLFIAIGSLPNTEFVNGLILCDESGYVISEDTNTNVENIFVAGDVRTKKFRQLVTSSSDGAIAAKNVIEYLKQN